MFWAAIRLLLADNAQALVRLDDIRDGFAEAMQREIEAMWSHKIGLRNADSALVNELLQLMILSKVDFTIFFRRLSDIPEQSAALTESFYQPSSQALNAGWQLWLQQWRSAITAQGDLEATSAAMKRCNPKYTWREWLIAPAYQRAEQGDASLIHELQEVFLHPYDEQSEQVAATYDRLKPDEFWNAGGISHYSCSS
jgi:uncharacterized protein YdiU (UPF0061 family)